MDHRDRAQKRILWQYRNGENYKRWIDTLPAIGQEAIEKPADLIRNILDIDRQVGAQLDILGRIVGVKRQAIVVDDSGSVFSLGKVLQIPSDMFQDGELGAWYDANQIKTLFQDAGGDIQVIAEGDPVGRIDGWRGVGVSATSDTPGDQTYTIDGGRPYIEHYQGSLSANFPNLGAETSLVIVTKDMVVFESIGSVSGQTLLPQEPFEALVYISRPLTDEDKGMLEQYYWSQLRDLTREATLYLNFLYGRYGISPSLSADRESNTFSQALDLTRGSSATYYGKSGLIETASANEPRFTHDPVTGKSQGLLVEEQRTNLLLWSEDFTQGDWTKTRTSVTSGASTAPDGNVTADKVVAEALSGVHDIYQLASSPASTIVTVSVFLRAAGYSGVAFRCSDPNFIGRAYFDLTTGELGNKDADIISHTIEARGGGWFRCTATYETTETGTSAMCQIQITEGSRVNFTGDGTSGIYIWGAQMEASS